MDLILVYILYPDKMISLGAMIAFNNVILLLFVILSVLRLYNEHHYPQKHHRCTQLGHFTLSVLYRITIGKKISPSDGGTIAFPVGTTVTLIVSVIPSGV